LTRRRLTADHGAVRSRRVVLVVFDGVQGIDVFGPADAFYFANFVAQQRGEDRPPYSVELAALHDGPVATAAGPTILASRTLADPRLAPDLLLVAGGLSVDRAADDGDLVQALTDLAARSGEVGSVCTGAMLLAATGMLDGRLATTHWALAEHLVARHPEVEVDADRIYALDGGVWSSAGVTAGIDLALQLIRTHHGSALAADVARYLVVYLQRAGGQRQYSTHLEAHRSSNPTIRDVTAHIADHPDHDLSIAALAALVNMSERSFQRLFRAEVGTSPGRYVEQARVDAARAVLEHERVGLATVARRCGFSSQERLIRTFHRSLGVTPGEYRSRYAAGDAGQTGP
jgi:transcriptional regulator GlxA family with amidase domain